MLSELLITDNLHHAFEKKLVDKSKKDAARSKKVSTLSAQLKDCPVLQKNPFLDYSMFDGDVSTFIVIIFFLFYCFYNRPKRESLSRDF